MSTTPRGLLLVWTNIPQDLDPDFNEWYNREHMPERRLGLDGFVRGRRFVAYEGRRARCAGGEVAQYLFAASAACSASLMLVIRP